MSVTEQSQNLAESIFPNKLPSIEELEQKYPKRSLSPDAMVTRLAPSPTGFMHIGSLYTALICQRLAHQTGGVFFVRIEDTDKKREVAGATNLIIQSLERYSVALDEGETSSGEIKGQYGPYLQSKREDIYQAYIKSLIGQGLAYPCFCTHEELEELHAEQEKQEVRPGYYGQWAKCRHRSTEEALAMLAEKKPFAIRFRSPGNYSRRIKVDDLLKGQRELLENDQDIVLQKSEGLPTYHLAHVVDDHLMRTTHVIRGDEWFSSLPLHLQLFSALNLEPPKYAHISPIEKAEGSSRRKLSKRKDPEASMLYYDEQGYPEQAIVEYLLNLANSSFEDWRREHPMQDNNNFKLNLKKMSASGALFDFVKLDSIAKDVVARLTAEEILAASLAWAKKFDTELTGLLEQNKDYTLAILNIERINTAKIRKDIAKWSDIKNELTFFFDEYFNLTQASAQALLENIKAEDIKAVLETFSKLYDENDANDAWFNKVKETAARNGFAENMKDYKEAPEKYKGNVADVAKILRVATTGRSQTPDLCAIMKVMGKERVMKRLSIFN